MKVEGIESRGGVHGVGCGVRVGGFRHVRLGVGMQVFWCRLVWIALSSDLVYRV